MNTFLVITLLVALPAYALLWHNQPARTQREKTRAIEAAYTFLLNPYWPTRIAALIAYWVASNLWRSLKKLVAQVFQPAMPPAAKSAGDGNCGKPADLEICDTAHLEVGATLSAFSRGFIPTKWQTTKIHAHSRTKM
jgi:hypothetical protein